MFIFRYLPMPGIVIAFKDFRLGQGVFGSEWAGLKWFKILFTTDDFLTALRNTLIISFMKIVINFPAPIILALMINEISMRRYKRVVQTVVYLPHFISWVIIGGILFTLLSPTAGIVSLFGGTTSPLMQPGSFRWVLVLSDLWKSAGWGTVVYLAAITGISPDLYEAAIIDGASRLQQVIHITLPSITGTIAVMLILRTGNILSAGFEQVYMLYNPLVYSVSDIIDTYVYRVGIQTGRFSLATAAGLFQSLTGMALLLFSNFMIRRMGEDGLW